MKKTSLIYTFIASTLIFLGVSFYIQAKSVSQPILTAFKERPNAPDFILKDMDGNNYKLSEQKGKVIVLNFWATWCPPCRKEMPSMESAWSKMKEDDILMWAVNTGETENEVFAFSAEYEVNFPLLLDETQATMYRYAVSAMPTTYIIDKQGKVAYYAIGERKWDDDVIVNEIKKLAAEK